MRIVNHYQCGVELPITQYNGSPFDYRSIEISDSFICLSGYTGGPYAAFHTNIDIDGNRIYVYDTKHELNYTYDFDHDLILDFVKFFKENIDIDKYLQQPTNSGLVMLSDEDTKKLKSWADAHKLEESIESQLFSKILRECHYEDCEYNRK